MNELTLPEPETIVHCNMIIDDCQPPLYCLLCHCCRPDNYMRPLTLLHSQNTTSSRRPLPQQLLDYSWLLQQLIDYCRLSLLLDHCWPSLLLDYCRLSLRQPFPDCCRLSEPLDLVNYCQKSLPQQLLDYSGQSLPQQIVNSCRLALLQPLQQKQQ